MTRRVREQMLCIVSSGWPAQAHAVFDDAAIRTRLQALLRRSGVIHYATFFVMPALGAKEGDPVDLVLELVVEEGLRREDVIARLAWDASAALWDVYRLFWSPEPAEGGPRNAALEARLRADAGIADGAFVGTRDRTVQQIRAERGLLTGARTHAAMVGDAHTDRRSLARALSRWAYADPALEAVDGPAPRSFWRKHGTAAKALLLLILIGFVGAVLYGLLWGLSLLPAALGYPGNSPACGNLAKWERLTFACVTSYPLHVYQRLLGLVVAAVGVLALLLGLLPALLKPWRRWLAAVVRELDRPTESWSSRLTYVSALIIVAGVGVGAAIYLLCGADPFANGLRALGWTVRELMRNAAIGLLVFVIVVCLLWHEPKSKQVARGPLGRQLRKLQQWFYRPTDDDVPRAQQVHPTIEACEAAQAHCTAHMISLTDLRRPYAWSAFWTVFFLRIVTFLGHVFFGEGRLGGAPGIHFGHWRIVQGGRRLLFCSNFDGAFGGYLDDFINGASRGTTLFWRWTRLRPRAATGPGQPQVAPDHGRQFPPTRLFAFKGVKCELTFKAYARDSMLPHLLRFDACNLTIEQIDLATRVRDALQGLRNDAKDDQIMRALES